MKKLTILLLLTFVCFNSYAQKSTLVKAYYLRAQEEYTQQNYEQAINFLERATEFAGNTINPDITYLQAKSHYINDVHVLKSKQLFLKFLYEASSNDYKRDEVSEIISDINSLVHIDASGYFKDLSGRNGTKKTFFSNETLQKVETFKNGKLEGIYQEYFENGKLFKEGTYENGVLSGKLKIYHLNGNIKLETSYSESGKHGIEQLFDDQGILTQSITYALNKKNGTFKTYFNDGKKIKEEGSYKADFLAGVFKQYHENGKLALSCIYGEDNSKDGPEIKYYYDGSQQWIKNFQHGKLRGIQKYFFENGQISKWEMYNDEGKLHGEIKEYYKNGKLAVNILYENGNVIDVIEQQNSKGSNINKSKLKQNPYGTGQITKLYDNNKVSYYAVYTDGVLDGEIKEFYESGQLKCEGFYNYGSRDGEFKHYYENGTLKEKGNYKSNYQLGFKDGEHTEYYETGEVSCKTIYQYNKEIEKTTYYKNGSKSGEYNYLKSDWNYFPETE
jgi:uncharacterized protein